MTPVWKTRGRRRRASHNGSLAVIALFNAFCVVQMHSSSAPCYVCMCDDHTHDFLFIFEFPLVMMRLYIKQVLCRLKLSSDAANDNCMTINYNDIVDSGNLRGNDLRASIE